MTQRASKKEITEREGEGQSLLRKARERRGWSREHVADNTESDPRTVGRWERGDSFPSPYHLQKLCEFYNMLPEELGLLQKNPGEGGDARAATPVLSLVGAGETQSRLDSFTAVEPLPGASIATGVSPPQRSFITLWGRNSLFRFALLSLCLLLVGSLALVVASSIMRTLATALPPQSLGSVYFVSSGQFNGSVDTGINDEVQISLHSIPPPGEGKSYFAWLLADVTESEAPAILLGPGQVTNGKMQFRYLGDAQHSNLLASTSRFLVTEEATTPPPIYPSIDTSSWKFYAEIPQKPSPHDGLSLLDHIRHLLAKDPTLSQLNLPGGLVSWLGRNTLDVTRLATLAKNDWSTKSPTALRADVAGILDYLDGENYINRDVPAGIPLQINRRIAQIGLLDFDTVHQQPPGYLYHINLHLNGVLQSPGATAGQHQLAAQINTALKQVNSELEHLRLDGITIEQMTDGQVLAPSTQALLQEMSQLAQSAYYGQVNAANGATQGGVIWIAVTIQHLATFDVMPYSAS